MYGQNDVQISNKAQRENERVPTGLNGYKCWSEDTTLLYAFCAVHVLKKRFFVYLGSVIKLCISVLNQFVRLTFFLCHTDTQKCPPELLTQWRLFNRLCTQRSAGNLANSLMHSSLEQICSDSVSSVRKQWTWLNSYGANWYRFECKNPTSDFREVIALSQPVQSVHRLPKSCFHLTLWPYLVPQNVINCQRTHSWTIEQQWRRFRVLISQSRGRAQWLCEIDTMQLNHFTICQ